VLLKTVLTWQYLAANKAVGKNNDRLSTALHGIYYIMRDVGTENEIPFM
jgi:hypothetical protein